MQQFKKVELGAFVVLAAPKLVGWLCLERQMGKGDGGEVSRVRQAEGPAFHRSLLAQQRNTSSEHRQEKIGGPSRRAVSACLAARRAVEPWLPGSRAIACPARHGRLGCVSAESWGPLLHV
jgi:hypothetical protein